MVGGLPFDMILLGGPRGGRGVLRCHNFRLCDYRRSSGSIKSSQTSEMILPRTALLDPWATTSFTGRVSESY